MNRFFIACAMLALAGCAHDSIALGGDPDSGPIVPGDDGATPDDAATLGDVKLDPKDGCYVFAGIRKTCVMSAQGTVRCWGAHPDGTSGTAPFDLVFPLPVVKLSLGEIGWWAILNDGSLWYANGAAKTPVQYAAAGTNVVDVSVGDSHACVVKNDGSLWCWGYNNWGSIGDGTTTDRAAPVPIVVQGVKFAQVVTSHFQTCALSTTGAAYCWGRNSFGQVGDGTTIDRLSPVQIIASGVTQIATGTSHTCAVKTDGSVWCWGGDFVGQLGQATNELCPWTPNPYPCAKKPQKVAALAALKAIEISAGQNHACARGADHSLWCWGNDSWGQIGDGMMLTSAPPTQVMAVGYSAAVGVTGGSADHTCARTLDGTLYCWGSNYSGEIGASTSSMCTDSDQSSVKGPCSPTPVVIGMITCLPPQGVN